MWNQLLWSVELCYLAMCTRSDIQNGWISVPFSVSCAVIGVVVRYEIWGMQADRILSEFYIGLLAVLVAVISRGALGMGDAWMILVSCALLGSVDSVMMVWWAFLFAGIYSAWEIVRKRKSRKDSFPFAPYLLAAYMVKLGGYWL